LPVLETPETVNLQARNPKEYGTFFHPRRARDRAWQPSLGAPMNQYQKMHSFESPWKSGQNTSSERAIVRGGPERPSFTRTPRARTHYINPYDAADLLDELFPEGVERIEVRFVYSETSYQKQFLMGRWALTEREGTEPIAYFEREEEADSVVKILAESTGNRGRESQNAGVRTIGFYPPMREVI
jgi:hypothetical protein